MASKPEHIIILMKKNVKTGKYEIATNKIYRSWSTASDAASGLMTVFNPENCKIETQSKTCRYAIQGEERILLVDVQESAHSINWLLS
jgi:hypothetical protein